MRIRIAILEDAPALARVIVDTGRVAHRAHVPVEALPKQPVTEAYEESERNWCRSLQEIADDPSPQVQIFVAEDDAGVVVGLAMGGPPKQELLANAGEVYVLYVRQEQHGRGLGRALVQAVGAHLVQVGMSALLIGCLAANTPARRFYERLGGRVMAERQVDQEGVLLPEVVYGWENLQVVGSAR